MTLLKEPETDQASPHTGASRSLRFDTLLKGDHTPSAGNCGTREARRYAVKDLRPEPALEPNPQADFILEGFDPSPSITRRVPQVPPERS